DPFDLAANVQDGLVGKDEFHRCPFREGAGDDGAAVAVGRVTDDAGAAGGGGSNHFGKGQRAKGKGPADSPLFALCPLPEQSLLTGLRAGEGGGGEALAFLDAGLHAPEEDMTDDHVAVLDTLHVVAGDDDALVDHFLQAAALVAGQAEDVGAEFAGDLYSAEATETVAAAP